MPRVDTTPARRTKRDGQQRLSHGVRTAASVRAAAIAAQEAEDAAAASAPVVKREPLPTPLPLASHPPRSWRHPDELPYIRTGGKTWDDMAIVRFLRANVFSVPPRSTRTLDQWVSVRRADGSEVVLPRGYRLPLLWVARFQWTSLQLVLTADTAIRQRDWDNTKFELLHIARLCATLLEKARAQMEDGGAIERGWRCALFDRALRRYWYSWLIMRDEFVRDFWREFGEAEFTSDVLKLGWSQWVLKDHKGFKLSKAEVANGITADEFMNGLVVDEDAGTFGWDDCAVTAEAEADDTAPGASTDRPTPAPALVRTRQKKTDTSSSSLQKPKGAPQPLNAHESSSPTEIAADMSMAVDDTNFRTQLLPQSSSHEASGSASPQGTLEQYEGTSFTTSKGGSSAALQQSDANAPPKISRTKMGSVAPGRAVFSRIGCS
ncbi:hypothetical protein B0H15DRAFT_159682 [Mycena belliarum]|uniref:Uncharacterized protein n=1 Tax=Mycena belliarum TaxID=1033014 RepID=A0AAD6XKQ4_9AGAR|nr:hypothetical protein B0H15DRAFT_159682 [Mycena belliae]